MRIAWEESGEGPALLLVHGLGYTRQGWGPARELLAGSFRVVAFDNRGIGESEVPPGPYTVEQLAGDALQVLDEAGIERAHVLGTSLGGFVAQEIAARAPGRVDKLVLACTMPGGPKSFPIPQPTLELMARMGTMPADEALRAFVVNALGDAPADGLVDEIYAYRLAHQPPLDGWQAQAAAGAAFDGFDRLGDIRAPTLVLTGLEDKVVDPRNVQLLNDGIAGSRVELFPGGGHLFFWEQPERFAAVVTEFLQ
jgi:pimeloyl-ACP methyl ester carboxylesterase